MEKKLYKIAFEVVFNPKEVIAIGEFMSRFDLGITGAQWPQTIVLRWTTTTKINKEYKTAIKKKISEFIGLEGHEIISVKQVKYEN